MAERDRKLLADGLAFGEGPRWRDGRLYFSDIKGERVGAVDTDGNVETVLALPGREPSGLGWLPDGRMLVVSMHDHRLLRADGSGGEVAEVADLTPLCGGHANDMVVDADGRAYVGNIGFDLAVQPFDPKPTNLIRIDPDGSVHVAAADMGCPNGLVITGDGRTLIAAESSEARLTAFDKAADGSLKSRRVYARLPDGAAPDGICIDAEDAVWVASPPTCEFLRVREGGEIAERISVAPRHAIACMLGGEDGKTLFLITSETMNPAAAKPLRSGRIETTRVDVPRAGWP